MHSSRQTPTYCWLILAALLLLTAAIRFHLISAPLERDEGEYAYAAQLLLRGLAPYVHLHTMKLPGIFAAYAAIIAILGESHTAIHLGLLLVNSATILLVFLLGRQLLSPLGAVTAAATFASLSLSPALQGIFANAEHFVILPALLGLLLLADPYAITGKKTFFSGLLLGLAFVTKQHGILFIVMGGIALILARRARKQSLADSAGIAALYASGVALPFAATCLLFFLSGNFEQFWFWTFQYARQYAGLMPLSEGWYELQTKALHISSDMPVLWGLAGLGIPLVFLHRQHRRCRLFLLFFLLTSFLATCPGFYFRPHYFILLLPAAALMAGAAVSSFSTMVPGLSDLRQRALIGLLILAFGCGTALYQQRRFLFQLTPEQASQQIYWPNPFVESLAIGREIAKRTNPEDRIAVIGSEPQILFYSQRRSATPYIYMYPLMEDHKFAQEMQRQMISEIEQARPKILVFVRVHFSWLQNQASHLDIFDWYAAYREQYHRIGLLQLYTGGTLATWGAAAEDLEPRSDFWLEIMARK